MLNVQTADDVARRALVLWAVVLRADGYDWEKFVDMPEKLEKLTKQDIIDFAKRTYIPKKRATVYKIVGQDTTIQKIPKPKITPIETNRDEQSFFVRRINEMPVSPIPAVFPDFKTPLCTP